ncbi:hypothetical protein NFJ02_01g41380 [Pycnococcus provasolii]
MYTARREYDPRATRKQVASLAGDWRAEAGHSMASTRRADHVAHTPAAPVSVRSSGFLARAGGMVCEGAGSLLRVGRLGARTPAHARVAGISGREAGQTGWHNVRYESICAYGGWSVASGVAHDYIDPLAASDARGAHFFGWLMPSVVPPGAPR